MTSAQRTALTLVVLLAASGTALAAPYKRAAYLTVNLANGPITPIDAINPWVGALLDATYRDIFISTLRSSYDEVKICKSSDEGASCGMDFVDDIKDLTARYEAVDLFTGVHGNKTGIYWEDDYFSLGMIPSAKKDWRQRHRLRLAAQLNCFGSYLLDGWLDLGFDVGFGSKELDQLGTLYWPYFMMLYQRKRCIIGGGDCSRSVREAIDAAWAPVAWLNPITQLVSRIIWPEGNQYEIDSTPVLAGMGELKVTSYKGIYNQCNDHGDAHGFMTNQDTCCMAGETCEDTCEPGQPCTETTFGCNGAEAAPVKPVNTAKCTGTQSFENKCATGKDCPGSGLCLATPTGRRCATACKDDKGCFAGDRCEPAVDQDGEPAGNFCVTPRRPEDIACICQELQKSGCGATSNCSGFAALEPLSMTGAGQSTQVTTNSTAADETVVFATGEPINWLARCGCKVSLELAQCWCGHEAAPEPEPAGGCNITGATDATPPLALLLLALLAPLRRRPRAAPPSRNHRAAPPSRNQRNLSAAAP